MLIILLSSLWSFFFIYILLNENDKVITALKKSTDYLAGRYWEITWRIFLLGLFSVIYGIFSSSFSPPVTMIINMLFVPFPLIYLFVMFKNLKNVYNESAIQVDEKNNVIGSRLILVILALVSPMMSFLILMFGIL